MTVACPFTSAERQVTAGWHEHTIDPKANFRKHEGVNGGLQKVPEQLADADNSPCPALFVSSIRFVVRNRPILT